MHHFESSIPNLTTSTSQTRFLKNFTVLSNSSCYEKPYSVQRPRKKINLQQKRNQKHKMVSNSTIKRRRKSRNESFNIYIYKVLKQVHPEMGVSKQTMKILNSFANDTFEKIGREAGNLVKYGKKQTMSARDILTATKLILPGELAKHAVSEGNKALQKYRDS